VSTIEYRELDFELPPEAEFSAMYENLSSFTEPTLSLALQEEKTAHNAINTARNTHNFAVFI